MNEAFCPLILYGMSHETADLEIRERIALSADEIRQILAEGIERPEIDALAILSTCNRTEIYAAPVSPEFAASDLVQLIATSRPSAVEIPAKNWYSKCNREVVRHFLRVASGLDSMMVGETQIHGQAKDCAQLYRDSGQSHPLFNRLFDQAFRCSKEVRSKTQLGEGAVSVAGASVDLALKIFGSLEGKTALLVGAGQTGQLAARHLHAKGIFELLIANRTRSRAEDLTRQLCGKVVEFTDLVPSLVAADVVVLATEGGETILSNEILERVLPQRKNRMIFIADLGVPRNCDPACDKHDDVFLYDIDGLKRLAHTNLKRRQGEVPKAEAIVDAMVEEYMEWFRTLSVEPTIRALMEQVETMRREVVERNRKQFDAQEMETVEALTRALVKKLFHTPLRKLKENHDSSQGLKRLISLQDLFDLKSETDDEDEDQNRHTA